MWSGAQADIYVLKITCDNTLAEIIWLLKDCVNERSWEMNFKSMKTDVTSLVILWVTHIIMKEYGAWVISAASADTDTGE